jgi:putative sporulation protein YtaF
MPLLVLLLAIAISIDGIAVGVAYGLKGLRVPPISMAVIGIASGIAVCAAMSIGRLLSSLLPPLAVHALAGGLLTLVGIYLIYQTREPEPKEKAIIENAILELRFRSFKLVVQILREPEVADFDRSGLIGTGESVLLGIALAVDAFGAGIAAGMANLSVPLTGVVTAILSIMSWASLLTFPPKRASTISIQRPISSGPTTLRNKSLAVIFQDTAADSHRAF